jgi:hypothetical protein
VGRSVSSWWREVAKIRDGEGVNNGVWFEECIGRKVGNGRDTFFWTNPWLGGKPFFVQFRCLFDLAKNKSITVSEMCDLGLEEGGVVWQQRRL